ncbi:hypothetical protein Vretifemale_18183 [Volvox reticuliferus]|uniref:Thioredoxin domain-containing protein n=1 Tax=Volvox reticuliferus TaxID=1737510 RepID=A0A8J4CWX8_9CHLO|nr:hypothetical protein Vretifemale_18183 [Volvox reticuliferus]
MSRFRVTGFPTIFLLRDGNTYEYNGPRNVDSVSARGARGRMGINAPRKRGFEAHPVDRCPRRKRRIQRKGLRLTWMDTEYGSGGATEGHKHKADVGLVRETESA